MQFSALLERIPVSTSIGAGPEGSPEELAAAVPAALVADWLAFWTPSTAKSFTRLVVASR